MKNLLFRWNIFRIIKLFIGIALVVEGFKTQGYVLILLGGVFALTTILNIGCGTNCATGSSHTASSTDVQSNLDDITYEEIK